MTSVINKKWKAVLLIDSDEANRLRIADNSIWTVDDEEVLGSSEWLRCNEETLVHIVNLHNKQVESK